MFKKIFNKKKEILDNKNILVAALLVHAAKIDNEYTDVEKKIIKQASFFEGKHDFQSFRSIDCQSKTTLKSLESFEVKKNKDILIFSICAKSFLHSQVRIMVGTLVDIGKGLIKESILDIIKSHNRAKAGMTAPSYGLYLKKIEY